MEDVSEDAVVNLIVLGVVRLLDARHHIVIERQLAADVAVDGRRRKVGHLLHLVHHGLGLLYLPDVRSLRHLSCLQGLELDVVRTFHHQLQHEPAHLTRVAVFRSIVVEQADVGGALQEAMEIVGVDGHLVVDGGQTKCLANGVGDERGVVHALGHIPLVAREHEHVVEVEVSRLEHAHDLYAFGRLSVEGDGGGRDELRQQALECRHVGLQVTVSHELVQSVDERVHAEERLLEERVGHLARLFPYPFEHLQQPIADRQRQGFIGCVDVLEQQGQALVKRQILARRIELLVLNEAVDDFLETRGDEFRVRMAQELEHLAQAVFSRLAHDVLRLHGDEHACQCREGRLRKWVARGDVHLLHFGRNAMHHRLQQTLVA